MAPIYQPEFLQELKARNDIIEVAGGYLSLEKRGGSYWACCPFHHEKTPSFAINASEQFYHCFGCGVSGDVIRFVQGIENLDFMDAVKLLAGRANMKLPESRLSDERAAQIKQRRDRLLKILTETARFYRSNLGDGHADAHVQYILDRQMTPQTVRRFGLGASLDFHSLPAFLQEKGFERQDILDSGVCSEGRDGKLIDFQAGRLIYPIISAMGDVIAFGGRLLEKKPDVAKYKNTRETVIFNKKKNLYNINLLKRLKMEQPLSSVIMVEGYMDVISLYQAGFKNVVASMGTSLTQDQARLLKRYCSKTYISYDGDAAGQKAAIRGLEIMQSEGVAVKVVPLPEGLDPDDVCKQMGAEGYQDCLDRALPLVEFKIAVAAKEHDPKDPNERGAYIGEVLKIIREAETESEKETLLKKLREETGITYESLKRDLEGLPQSSAARPVVPPQKKEQADFKRKAERFILAACLFNEPYTKDVFLEGLPFTETAHLDVVDFICDCRDRGETPRPSDVFTLFEGEEPEVDAIVELSEEVRGERGEKYFRDSIRVLERFEIEKQISELNAAYAQEKDVERRRELAYRIQELTKALKN
ncbi:MAG: DNA primase [Christensenellaceae bacterium]